MAGLQSENAKQRANQVLDNYRKAFSGFPEDELAMLDMLEPVVAARPTPTRRMIDPAAGPFLFDTSAGL